MDRGSTERLPRETPAPEDYYELTNSQPPATCVGCQAWSKAQGSGSCPVGVRRFKSCPTHSFRSLISKEPQIIPTAVSVIRTSSPFGHLRDGDLDNTTQEGVALLPRPQVGRQSMYEDRHSIGTLPVRSHPRIESIQRTFVYSHLIDLIKAMTRADDIRPPRCLRYGYTFERFVL